MPEDGESVPKMRKVEPGDKDDPTLGSNLLPEERIAEDPNAEPEDEDFDIGGDPLWTPTTQQIRDLKIAHDNLGHPSNRVFARMIKLGNGRPEIVRWIAKHFKCDDCEAHWKPKARRPSAVPRSYRFNHVVGVDLIDVKDIKGENNIG